MFISRRLAKFTDLSITSILYLVDEIVAVSVYVASFSAAFVVYFIKL